MAVLSVIRVEKAAFKEVSLNSFMLALQYGATALVPLILVPHIVRMIGISSFGNIAVALSWATFASLAVQYAFHLTGPKRVAQRSEDETATAIFAEISLAKLALFICVVPIVLAITWSTVPSSVRAIDTLVVLVLPAAAVLGSSWYLQALGRFAWISIAAAMGAMAALSFGFTRVVNSDSASILSAAWACVLGPVITGGGTFVAALGFVALRGSAWRQIRPIRALKEGGPLFASQFVATLYTASGPIIISHLASTADAGAYGAVDRFVAAITGGCLLVHTAAYPRLAATYGGDKPNYRRLLALVVASYLSFTALLALVAWFFRARLARFLLGGVQSYTPLLEWGLLYLVVAIFGTAVTGYLTVSGRAREVLPLTFKILVCSFAFGLPGAWKFGAIGWMAARVLSQLPNLTAALRLWREESARG